MIAHILLLFLFAYSSGINALTLITSLQEFKKATTHEHDPVCAFVVADWCTICSDIKPHIESIMNDAQITSRMDFVLVSFDAIPELAAEFGVTKVPTFCFFNKDGELVEKIEGVKNIETAHDFLTEKIEAFLSKTTQPQSHYLKKYIPSKNETQQWVAMHCKTCLIHVRNGIDFLIQKCFNEHIN
jgi:thioredoxin-like negative regulator of GroEL